MCVCVLLLTFNPSQSFLTRRNSVFFFYWISVCFSSVLLNFNDQTEFSFFTNSGNILFVFFCSNKIEIFMVHLSNWKCFHPGFFKKKKFFSHNKMENKLTCGRKKNSLFSLPISRIYRRKKNYLKELERKNELFLLFCSQFSLFKILWISSSTTTVIGNQSRMVSISIFFFLAFWIISNLDSGFNNNNNKNDFRTLSICLFVCFLWENIFRPPLFQWTMMIRIRF